ncbi:MAG: hypothetical protein ACXW3Z_10815 [Limisphaerales bacterium]
MIRKKLTTLAALTVALATLTVNSNALTTIQIKKIRSEVLSVPVPEMPAKAAELVKLALKKDRQATALTAMRAIVEKHRAAAPLVVSAISKVAPDLAPAVAAAGAQIAPEQAPTIASAAVAAAPAQAVSIQNVVTKAVPTQAPAVVASVTQTTTRGSSTATRGSAHAGAPTGGTVTISGTAINGGAFPTTPPTQVGNPVVVYNQPAP